MYIIYVHMQNFIQTASLHHHRLLPYTYGMKDQLAVEGGPIEWSCCVLNGFHPLSLFSIIEWLLPYFLKPIEHQIRRTYILSFTNMAEFLLKICCIDSDTISKSVQVFEERSYFA